MARISLVLQLLRWAAGEGECGQVDMQSVEGAIALGTYFEDSYRRLDEVLRNEVNKESKADQFLALVGDAFKTEDALVAGEFVRLGRSSVYALLNQLVAQGKIENVAHGQYRVVKS
ncbi:MAG: DUF3987 domain-containing protein [Bacteroidales bacterium]|nr:DUF3987 domain-containing protein [Bacteroidales bacterium]